MKCSIAVGTENELKYRAVLRALANLCTVEKAVMVGVHGLKPQPVGMDEVVAGAIVRAIRALEKAETDYGVGVEAGPLLVAGIGLEVQAAAIVDVDGRLSLGLSQGFMVPSTWLEAMIEGKELGTLAEKATGRKRIGQTHGLVSYLTFGRVSRGDLTYEAVVMALIPRLNPDLYGPLPHYRSILNALGYQ